MAKKLFVAHRVFVALLVLYFCSMLFTEIEAQRLQICTSNSCGEGECCVRNSRFGVCSNGTKDQLCGGSSNSCTCAEGLECNNNQCRAPKTTTSTTLKTSAP